MYKLLNFVLLGAFAPFMFSSLPGRAQGRDGGLAKDTYYDSPRSSKSYSDSDGNIDVRNSGIKCDGSDETAAWNTLFSRMQNGGTIAIRHGGICAYTTISIPERTTIDGGNRSSTIFRTLSANLDGIILNNGSALRHIGLDAEVKRTGGAFVVTSANGTVISDIQCTRYFICYRAIGLSANKLTIGPTVENVLAFNPVVGSGSCFAVFENYSNAIVDKIVVTGSRSGEQPDCGVQFTNGDTAFVSNSNVTRHGIGLYLNASGDRHIYATHIVNSLFDSAGKNSAGYNAPSCVLHAAGHSGIYESVFTNIWCGLSSSADGLLLETAQQGTVDTLIVTAGQFDGNGQDGVHIAGDIRNWSFVGGSSSGNGNAGIEVGGITPSDGQISSMHSGKNFRGQNLGYGLKLSNGRNIKIRDNIFAGGRSDVMIEDNLDNVSISN